MSWKLIRFFFFERYRSDVNRLRHGSVINQSPYKVKIHEAKSIIDTNFVASNNLMRNNKCVRETYKNICCLLMTKLYSKKGWVFREGNKCALIRNSKNIYGELKTFQVKIFQISHAGCNVLPIVGKRWSWEIKQIKSSPQLLLILA